MMCHLALKGEVCDKHSFLQKLKVFEASRTSFLKFGCRKITGIFLNREFLSEILLCSGMQRPKDSRTTVLDGRGFHHIPDIKKSFFLSLVFVFLLFNFAFVAGGVDVSSLLLKVSVNEGDSAIKTITISSYEDQDFIIDLLGVKGISLSKSQFSLEQNQKIAIDITFNSSELKAGVYVGSILISGSKDKSYLPVIFEVQSKNSVIGINLDIPPQYTQIEPGSKVIAQIKLFDLTSNGGTTPGISSLKIRLDYFLYLINGELITSESEDFVINNQAQLTKTISLPTKVQEGDYVLSVQATYASSTAISSKILSIQTSEDTGKFDNNFISLVAVLVFVFLLFLVLIIMFFYFIRDRDKLMIELKKYNSWELEKQKEILEIQTRLIDKKKVSPKKVEIEVASKLRKLKAKHKMRVDEFNKLNQKGELALMRSKLAEWKEKGYNTLALESKLSPLKPKEMKKLLKEWKFKYSAGKTEGYKNK